MSSNCFFDLKGSFTKKDLRYESSPLIGMLLLSFHFTNKLSNNVFTHLSTKAIIEANCFAAVICKKAKKKSNKFNP